MAEVESATLVRLAAGGDEAAWEGIVDRFADLVWAVARGHGLGHADSADVSQTTWLRLAENIVRLRDPERVGAWLITTAKRESLRCISRSRRQVLVESCADFCGEDPIGHLEERLADTARRVSVRRAFDRISEPCQQLLRILMADPPPSYADVSLALDIPIGSIGPTRARCLARLRGSLGEVTPARSLAAGPSSHSVAIGAPVATATAAGAGR